MENGDRIQPLHAYYCKKTGLDLPLKHPLDYLWRRLIKQGWTDREFHILIRWVIKRRRDKKVTDAALRISNLLDPIKAAENLAAANRFIAATQRAEKRAASRLASQPSPDPSQEAEDVQSDEITQSLKDLKARLNSSRPT